MKNYIILFLVVLGIFSGCNPNLKQYQLDGKITVNNKCGGVVPPSVQIIIKLYYKDSTATPENWIKDVALAPAGNYSVETVKTNLEADHWEITITPPCNYINCPAGKECMDYTTRERNWNIVPVTKQHETKDIDFTCECRSTGQ